MLMQHPKPCIGCQGYSAVLWPNSEPRTLPASIVLSAEIRTSLILMHSSQSASSTAQNDSRQLGIWLFRYMMSYLCSQDWQILFHLCLGRPTRTSFSADVYDLIRHVCAHPFMSHPSLRYTYVHVTFMRVTPKMSRVVMKASYICRILSFDRPGPSSSSFGTVKLTNAVNSHACRSGIIRN